MPRGRSAGSVHSDSSEMDINGIAEAEMAKLHRQFRIMEGDRQAYGAQSHDLIRRQRSEIEKLLEEQEELLRSLRISESHSHRQRDADATQNLRTILSHHDGLDEQLDREKQSLAQLDKEVFSLERSLAELRKVGSTVAPSLKSEAHQNQKITHTLENRLDRALICFNKQLAKNAELRGCLETLHLERIRFQQLHHKLEKELQEIRKGIGEMISQSTVAYDARVEAQSKIVTMKEKAEKDLAQYSAEMRELERVIAHERRLKDFMSIKSNERTSQEEGQDPSRRQETEAKERRRTDSGEDPVHSLEEAFLRIHSVTGEEDLDMLVTKFIQVEDRNFALFNYVNEQNNEAETLKDQIHQLQQEMDQFRTEELHQEAERHALLKDMDAQQRDMEAQAQGYEDQGIAASKILDQIKTGVNRVFEKLDCDRSVIEDMLGSSAGIRDNNIMIYLGLVEQRTNELLTMQAFLSSKDLENYYDPKDVARVLLGQSADLPRQDELVQVPITGDGYDIEESLFTDEEERPLTQQELRQRIMKGVLRKEGAAQPGRGKDYKVSRVTLVSRQHSPEPFTGFSPPRH